jgi:hypothetical protein
LIDLCDFEKNCFRKKDKARITILKRSDLLVQPVNSETNFLSSPRIKSDCVCSPQLPGHPPLTAERYPLPSGISYYEGRGLIGKEHKRLIGRELEYKSLNNAVSGMLDNRKNESAIAISGMGGIG